MPRRSPFGGLLWLGTVVILVYPLTTLIGLTAL